MAFIKSVDHPTGVQVQYWRIVAYTSDLSAKINKVWLAGYLNKDSRTANKDHIIVRDKDLPSEKFLPDATRATLYGVLKTEGWADAQDD